MSRKLTALLLGLVAGWPELASGGLSENEVLLLWNSQDSDSYWIRYAYKAIHPNVKEYDLNINYAALPAPVEINEHYITKSKFHQLFYRRDASDALTPFEYVLTISEPQVRSIAVTRGLPAAIAENTDDFAAQPVIGDPPTCTLLWGSFEAALANHEFDATLGTFGVRASCAGNLLSGRPNKYFRRRISFSDEFVCAGPTPMSPGPGGMYLVSRLDGADYLATIAMIAHAQSLRINKFGVNIVFDLEAPGGIAEYDYAAAARRLFDSGWCVLYDNTSEFVHGPADMSTWTGPFSCCSVAPPGGQFDADDVPFAAWPLLGLGTVGHHHACQAIMGCAVTNNEPASRDYAGKYGASVGGVFVSYESYNGWKLHEPGVSPFEQGSVVDWISGSSGSFAIGNIQEPTGSNVAELGYLLPNLLDNGLTWGEAAYSSLYELAQYQTPLGDPLARVVAFSPDVNEDRQVNQTDLDLVTSGSIDVNLDGVFDGVDVAEVVRTMGRSCAQSPPVPNPAPALPRLGRVACGDLNGDGLVNEGDLGAFLPHWGERCFGADLTGDLLVDGADLGVLLGIFPWCIGDLNGDGLKNSVDYALMDALLLAHNDQVCSPDNGYSKLYDFNCDGCVDRINDGAQSLGWALGPQACP